GLARIVSLVSRGMIGGSVDEVELNPLVWTGEEWVAVDWLVVPSALATDVGDVQGESGASPGKDAGRRRTWPFVEDEDAASDVIWPC
ncbi:MAG: hypothetical protein ACRDX9_00005, partial [Acidimicrobiia bacterium]